MSQNTREYVRHSTEYVKNSFKYANPAAVSGGPAWSELGGSLCTRDGPSPASAAAARASFYASLSAMLCI